MLRPKDEILKVRIKENSLRARIAAFNLKTDRVAMVWNKTILLHNTTREEFLSDQQWVLHELRHILQVRKMGWFRFLWYYLKMSWKYGYYGNPVEVDARAHNNDVELLEIVEFV